MLRRPGIISEHFGPRNWLNWNKKRSKFWYRQAVLFLVPKFGAKWQCLCVSLRETAILAPLDPIGGPKTRTAWRYQNLDRFLIPLNPFCVFRGVQFQAPCVSILAAGCPLGISYGPLAHPIAVTKLTPTLERSTRRRRQPQEAEPTPAQKPVALRIPATQIPYRAPRRVGSSDAWSSPPRPIA